MQVVKIAETGGSINGPERERSSLTVVVPVGTIVDAVVDFVRNCLVAQAAIRWCGWTVEKLDFCTKLLPK
jgi:hypothetical protein